MTTLRLTSPPKQALRQTSSSASHYKIHQKPLAPWRVLRHGTAERLCSTSATTARRRRLTPRMHWPLSQNTNGRIAFGNKSYYYIRDSGGVAPPEDDPDPDHVSDSEEEGDNKVREDESDSAEPDEEEITGMWRSRPHLSGLTHRSPFPSDLNELLEYLTNIFGVADRQITAQNHINMLRRPNRTFSVYYTEFARDIRATGYNVPARKAALLVPQTSWRILRSPSTSSP